MQVWFGLTVMFYCLALSSFLSPSQTSQTGLYGWLHASFFNVFGPQGDTVLNVILGTVCLTFGILSKRANR